MTVSYKQMIAAGRVAIPFLLALPPLPSGAAPVTNAQLSYLQVRAMAEPYDLRVFGAIGDGQSHPLYQRYGTGSAGLAAARAVYPLAVSVNDEIDLCAAEAAVFFATLAGGAMVTDHGGEYRFNRTWWFPECGMGITANSVPQAGVSFRGAGENATRFKSVGDWAGYLVNCRNRELTQYGSIGRWQNMTLIGPAYGQSVPRGQKPCLLGGYGWGSRRMMTNCRAQDFHIGLSIIGDQSHFDKLSFYGCFYGIYFDKGNPYLFGDHLFSKPIIDQCFMAAVGVHPEAQIPKSQWDAPIFAASPFGIYKELTGANQMAHRQTVMTNPQFENMGHSAIGGGVPMPSDAAAGTQIAAQGDDRPDTQNTVFVKPQFGEYFDPARITGWRRGAMIDLNQCHQGLTIQGINEPQNWKPGEDGLISVHYPSDIHIEGDIEQLITNAAAEGRAFFASWTRGDTIKLKHLSSWEGYMRQMNGDPAVVRGACLVEDSANVRNSTGSTTELYAGVAMSEPRFAYDYIAVAERGMVEVNTTATGTATLNGVAIYPGINGRFTNAAGSPRSTEKAGLAYPGSSGTLGKQNARLR